MVMRVAVPVLPCRDVQAARSYFTDVLGFDTQGNGCDIGAYELLR